MNTWRRLDILLSSGALLASFLFAADWRPARAAEGMGKPPVVRAALPWSPTQPPPADSLPVPRAAPSPSSAQESPLPPGMRLPEVAPLASEEFQVALPRPADPPDYAAQVFDQPGEEIGPGEPRRWTPALFFWEPTALYYQPLYFEETNLERHGLSFGCAQPAVSAGVAFGRVVALPYMMAKRPPHRLEYTLGHMRPGNPVPYRVPRLPSDPRGWAAEAGVVAGAILLFP